MKAANLRAAGVPFMLVVFLLATMHCRPMSVEVGAVGTRIELPSESRLAPVREYIKESWTTLSRSHSDLLQAIVDPKIEHEDGEPWVLYVSHSEDPAAVRQTLASSLSATEMEQIEVVQLPESPRDHMGDIRPHGLLYLPHPYVVPGGRFNEMYGWDSYFIQVGLLRDGEIERAQHMVDNFLYQVEHYGTILNANRSYYLTRSQPPFLTAMILGVYRETGDGEWLESTLPAIDSFYSFWTSEPHLIGDLGLSRYHGFGVGEAPEVVSDERDERGRTHYDRVREYYRTTPVTAYDLSLYYDEAKDQLTPLFYVGDRTMRESGFDPSNRFGPFNIDIIHFAPVCLNSLLFRMELEAAEIYELLGRPDDASSWYDAADRRRRQVNEYLWDETGGMYMDYDFRERELSDYEFASTFYPLWVGLASDEQARRVVENLYRFEAPGGLLTSTRITGSQWDAPFAWGPLQMIASQGLRRYGYHADADRLTAKFVELVTKEFEEHAVIVEKYDAVQRESDVEAGIRFGYSENQVGFGWTNAAFIEMLSDATVN